TRRSSDLAFALYNPGYHLVKRASPTARGKIHPATQGLANESRQGSCGFRSENVVLQFLDQESKEKPRKTRKRRLAYPGWGNAIGSNELSSNFQIVLPAFKTHKSPKISATWVFKGNSAVERIWKLAGLRRIPSLATDLRFPLRHLAIAITQVV